VHRPDRFDPSKQVLSVLLSDAPLPSRALFDGLYLYVYKHARKIQVVEFDFTPDGVKWFFDPKGGAGSMSMSRSPNPFSYEVFEAADFAQVLGMMREEQPKSLKVLEAVDTAMVSDNMIKGKIEGKSERESTPATGSCGLRFGTSTSLQAWGLESACPR
jgi:hypothetical protein